MVFKKSASEFNGQINERIMSYSNKKSDKRFVREPYKDKESGVKSFLKEKYKNVEPRSVDWSSYKKRKLSKITKKGQRL